MQPDRTGGFGHLLCRSAFHSRSIIGKGKAGAAEGGSTVVGFNSAGGIVNGTDGGQDSLLGGVLFLHGEIAVTAGIQLGQDLLPGQFFLIRVDAGGDGEDALGAVIAGADGVAQG